MYNFDWPQIAQEQWMRDANEGYISIYNDADREWCDLIDMIIDKWIVIPETKPQDVMLNIVECQSGYGGSWPLSRKLASLPCRTMAKHNAHSAGLFLFMAGEERLAHRGAEFIFHGNVYRMMASGPTNEERAEWFSSRTNMPYDWWLRQAELNEVLTFGFDEAMVWGVATGEIADR